MKWLCLQIRAARPETCISIIISLPLTDSHVPRSPGHMTSLVLIEVYYDGLQFFVYCTTYPGERCLQCIFKKHKLFQALHNLLCLLLANKVREENQGTVDMDL